MRPGRATDKRREPSPQKPAPHPRRNTRAAREEEGRRRKRRSQGAEGSSSAHPIPDGPRQITRTSPNRPRKPRRTGCTSHPEQAAQATPNRPRRPAPHKPHKPLPHRPHTPPSPEPHKPPRQTAPSRRTSCTVPLRTGRANRPARAVPGAKPHTLTPFQGETPPKWTKSEKFSLLLRENRQQTETRYGIQFQGD